MELVDCQVRTEHLARFGAREIPRDEFLARLRRALEKPGMRGRWDLEPPSEPPPDEQG
jgi:leucyl/phenylalanyl-tRNA--protein transferase